MGSSGWSNAAYLTGPAVTLDVTEVDEVPYGTPPDVTLTPKAGGYDLAFEIPRGMIIEPGTTTTLAPDQPAAVTFVPVEGGYRLDIAIPRGPTGDIDGVTPFWNMRLGSDANATAARAGLGASEAGSAFFSGSPGPIVTNYDTAVAPGIYSGPGGASGVIGAPPGSARYGTLTVTRRGNIILQRAVFGSAASPFEAYERGSSDGGATWGDWVTPSPAPVAARPQLIQLAKNSAQPISSTSAITWTSAVVDEVGAWSAGQPSRITVPAGYSHIRMRSGVVFAPNPSGDRQIYVEKNGAEYPYGYISHRQPATATGSTSFTTCSPWMVVEEGDYFEIFANQTSGAPLNVSGVESTWWEVEFLPAP